MTEGKQHDKVAVARPDLNVYTNLETGEAVLRTGNTPSSIYCTTKLTGRRCAVEVQHSAGAPKLCGRFTERLVNNSSSAQSNHACINTPAMNLYRCASHA